MRIDPTDFVNALTAQRGTLAAARAKAIQTAADEARYRDLVSAGAVSASASAYDQIKAAADAAKAQQDAAEAQVRVSKNETGVGASSGPSNQRQALSATNATLHSSPHPLSGRPGPQAARSVCASAPTPSSTS
jgi:multidrug efflux pump subunit AcrA (membrane-fusion protein)